VVNTTEYDQPEKSKSITSTRGTIDFLPSIAVHFAIPGTGPFSIDWSSMNIQVTEALTIDATTQPGYGGSPVVEIHGNLTQVGLTITGGASVVRGLAINRFTSAISLETNSGNLLEGNYVGVGTNGVTPERNLGAALFVASNTNTIGGTSPQARNILFGGDVGVVLFFGTLDTVIEGNYIGLDATGSGVVANHSHGMCSRSVTTA
jgi:hypothetical protein